MKMNDGNDENAVVLDEYDPLRRMMTYTPRTTHRSTSTVPTLLCVTEDVFLDLYGREQSTQKHVNHICMSGQTKPHTIRVKRTSVFKKWAESLDRNAPVIYVIVDVLVVAHGRVVNVEHLIDGMTVHWALDGPLRVSFSYIMQNRAFHFDISPKYKFRSYFSRRDFLDPRRFLSQGHDTTDLRSKTVVEIRAIRFNVVMNFLTSLMSSGSSSASSCGTRR